MRNKTEDKDVRRCLSFLQKVLTDYPRNFTIRFWDKTTWPADACQPTLFTWVIQHPSALRRLLGPPAELLLAEGYIYNDFDIEGDLQHVFPLGHYLASRGWPRKFIRLVWDWLLLPSSKRKRKRRAAILTGWRHSIQRDRQAIVYHYDVSNDFYRLWLDEQMVYSCAYFNAPDEDLNTAQVRKLDYICKKLRLQDGERLLDIGCGWGGLVIHAARHYGAQAVGVTLSERQAELANERIRAEGLENQCRVEVRDYRTLENGEAYDKVASIGMFEHVGCAQLATFFSHTWNVLTPGGLFLNQGIAIRPAESSKIGAFANRYVFPDGELVPIGTALREAELSGFQVRDVESLREHYFLTLRHWLQNLERKYKQVVSVTDETIYRVWRLYLSSSAYGFQTGRFDVYQTLFSKPKEGMSGLPLTRADWYR